MMKRNCRKDGFTMIEVVLVLAIAGLIFLMVFVALPALSKSQRDAERREDIIALISAIKKYQTNNRGTLPDSAEELDGYLGTFSDGHLVGFEDPDGPFYELSIDTCEGASGGGQPCTNSNIQNLDNVDFPNYYHIYVVSGATCDGSTVVKSNNPRNVAVTYRLEGGAHCNNS